MMTGLLLAVALTAHPADVTWRIHPGSWMDDAAFAELEGAFVTNGITGKIAFFSSTVHTPMRLDELERRTAVLARRIAAFKSHGYVAGINHLDTLGHLDECLSVAAEITGASRFTNIAGQSGKAQYCPADPVWREQYLAPAYRLLAQTGADFIWTDDDIRLFNHAVPGGGCFCEGCMRRLNARLGGSFDRPGLVSWLDDPQEGMSRRRIFLQHNRETLADLYAFIGRTIHAVAPRMDIGVMDAAGCAWQGMGYEEIYRALKTPESEVYWRPGGGFYTDEAPDYLVYKANLLAGEAERLPSDVCHIEAELESFIYQRADKSEFFTSLESLLYVALGLNGVAYNAIGPATEEPVAAYLSLMRKLEGNRPAYDWMVRAAGRDHCRGIWSGGGERDAAIGLSAGRFLAAEWISQGFVRSELLYAGLPPAHCFEDAVVFAPCPEVVLALPKEKIEKMLSTGVYLDVASLRALNERGYGADLGFEEVGPLTDDVHERFADHPFNAGFVGRERNPRQKFFRSGDAVALRALPGAEVVSAYVDETGAEIPGSCAMGVFTNTRGGRVCVNAYVPWNRVLFRDKLTQLRRVFDWLAHGRLPGRLRGHSRAALWMRGDSTAVVLNASQDVARDLEIELPPGIRAATMILPPSVREVALAVRAEPEGGVLALPELGPWSIAFLKLRRTAVRDGDCASGKSVYATK